MTCYQETLKEYIENLGNLLGTTWELVGNIMKIHWEQKKPKKNPPQNPKK
jgi:hypothetical protein